MAGKSNIRSMRFSDEIIQLIEQQPGDSFTAKFEYLIRKCVKELPEKEKQLQFFEEQIKEKRDRLNRLTSKAYQLENSMFNVGNLIGQYTNMVKSQISKLENE